MHYCETGTCEIADPGECPNCFHPIPIHGHDGCRYRFTTTTRGVISGATTDHHDDCPCLEHPADLIADAVSATR